MDIQTAEVDADDVEQLKALFNSYKPELVINLALGSKFIALPTSSSYFDTKPIVSIISAYIFFSLFFYFTLLANYKLTE